MAPLLLHSRPGCECNGDFSPTTLASGLSTKRDSALHSSRVQTWPTEMSIRCLFTVVGLIAVSATTGAASSAEDTTVNYTKSLPAAKLDKHLPGVRLDKWLQSGPPHLEDVDWQVNEDCGIRPQDREPLLEKRPLCVKFVFRRSGPGDPVDGSGFIKVGTLGQGIAGPPEFLGFRVAVPVGAFMGSPRLSDLPSVLNEASAFPKADKEKLDYARNLDVHKLDLALPSMRLEDWLRSGPAGIEKLNWRTSPTCDLKDPPPLSNDKDDWATCVKFVFAYKGVSESPAYVEGMITVGTVRKGITGPPRFEHFGFMDNDFFQRNRSWEPDFDTNKLSDLFRALAVISSR